MQPKTLSLEYIAGFVDGEGCISIQRFKKRMAGGATRYSPRITITNTHLGILERIKSIFPVGRKIRKHRKIPNRQQVYSLIIDGLQVAAMLDVLIPFLIIKKEQAQVLKEFIKTLRCKHEHRKKIPDTILDLREEYYWKLRYLKNPTEAGIPILEANPNIRK